MKGAKGFLIITDPDPPKGVPGVQERDTFTCAHCNTVHTVRPLAKPHESPGRCFQCDKLICQPCLNQPCIPFERKLEELYARERLWRAL